MKSFAVGLVVIPVLITACVTSTEPSTVPTTRVAPSTLPETTTPEDVETIRIGTTQQLTNLDAADAYLPHDWEVLGNIGRGLTSYTLGSTEVAPGISESFAISNSGRTYTFRLRADVLFPDGTELTASVYERHLQRMLGLDPVDGGGSSLGEPFVASVEAVDDITIEFHLHAPSGFFPAVVAGVPYHPSHPGLPADQVTPLPPEPVYGVGPWTVTSYEPQDRTVLEPHPLSLSDPPEVERVVIHYFALESELLSALFEGTVDIAWPLVPPGSIDDLPADIRAFPTGAGPIRVLVINHALAPTDSLAVRQALAAAVDREALLAVLGTSGQILRSPIAPGFLGASSPFAATADPDTAIQLLTQAGYSRDAPLEVQLAHPSDRYGDTGTAAVAAIAEQWEATGLIRVESRTADWDTYISQLLAGTVHEVALLGWSVDYFDPHPFVEPFTAFGGLGTNISDPDTGTVTEGLSHPELLDLVALAAAELDQTRRADLYLEIQDLWADDVVTIPLWWEPAWVFYRDGVTSRGESPFTEALNIGPTGFLDYTLLSSG